MATSMETLTTATSVVVGVQGPKQFQGLFDIIPFTVSLAEASLVASAAGTKDITVTGAALGDFVLISSGQDNVSVLVSAFVASANTVTIVCQNLEVSDANTSLSVAATANGIVLKPKQNVLAFGP